MAFSTPLKTQILIEWLSVDTKIPGHLCFLFACRCAEIHFSNLFTVECFLATPLSIAMLFKLNSFPLPLSLIRGRSNSAKAPMNDNIIFTIGESSTLKIRFSLINSIQIPLLVSICTRQ